MIPVGLFVLLLAPRNGNAVAAHASADVENLHGVVSQRQLVFPVKAEMVEASLDTRHGNRFGQDPRSRRFGLGGFLSVQSKREPAGKRPSEADLKSALQSFLPGNNSGIMGGKPKMVVLARPLDSNFLDASKAQ